MFSCLCFPHTRPYNKHKLAYRFEPYVYLGFAPQHKGYNCLSKFGKVFITRHVVFDEMMFPFKEFFEGFLLVAPSATSQAFPQPVLSIPVIHASYLPLVLATIALASLVSTNLLAPSVPIIIASTYASPLITAPDPPLSVLFMVPATPTVQLLVLNDHNMTSWAKAGIRKPKEFVVSLKHKSLKRL